MFVTLQLLDRSILVLSLSWLVLRMKVDKVLGQVGIGPLVVHDKVEEDKADKGRDQSHEADPVNAVWVQTEQDAVAARLLLGLKNDRAIETLSKQP